MKRFLAFEEPLTQKKGFSEVRGSRKRPIAARRTLVSEGKRCRATGGAEGQHVYDSVG